MKVLEWFNEKGRKFFLCFLGVQIGVVAFYTSAKFSGDNLVYLLLGIIGIYSGFNVWQKNGTGK